MTHANRVADVEFLLGNGVRVLTICQRLNTTPAAMARYLYRQHRRDLAAPFQAEERRQNPRTNRKRYPDGFPRYHPKARTWAAANGWPSASGGRVTKAAFEAWQQAQERAA
jgi:hypothetical protein